MAIARSLFIFFLLVFSAKTQGQISFANVGPDLGLDQSYSDIPSFGGSISFVDFNQDGWDDITMTTDSLGPLKFFKNLYGTFVETSMGLDLNSDDRSAFWIDYDNDNDLDLFVVTREQGVRLYKNLGPNLFQDVTIASGFTNMGSDNREGCGLGDFNNDGLLDFYDCSYELENALYFQNPNHTFSNVTSISGTGDSSRASFQALSIDYNQDGHLDIYVSNDYFDGNRMYHNNGDSTFTDVSQTTGAYQSLFSMGTAPGDFDNDLDFDIYITDRFYQSRLIRNDSNTGYTEIGQSAGVNYPGGFGWGCVFFDADYDGDEDLYVSGIMVPFTGGEPSVFFVNDGFGSFSETILDGDSLFSFASALGDFNNDRLTDIVVLNSAGNGLSLWENQSTTTVPRITVELEGCASNKQGIGATLTAYAGDEAHLYGFFAIESFLGQSSQRKVIPLYEGNTFDSLVVKWPSGTITKLLDVLPNQRIIISECDTARPDPVILIPTYSEHELTLCENDTIEIYIDGDYSTVLWSTGATGNSISIFEPGQYAATVTNQFGQSETTSSVSFNHVANPAYTALIDTSICYDGSGITIVPDSQSALLTYQWSNGQTGASIENLTPGVYYVTISTNGLCPVIDSFVIPDPIVGSPIQLSAVLVEPSCYGGSNGQISLTATGGIGQFTYTWSNGAQGTTIHTEAGTYTVTATDSIGCSADTSFALQQPNQIVSVFTITADTNEMGTGAILANVSGGISPYEIQWFDSLLQTGNTALNLSAGNYQVSISDQNQCDTSYIVAVPALDLTHVLNLANQNGINCESTINGLKIVCAENHTRNPAISVYDVSGRIYPSSYHWISDQEANLSVNCNGAYVIEIKGVGSCKWIETRH